MSHEAKDLLVEVGLELAKVQHNFQAEEALARIRELVCDPDEDESEVFDSEEAAPAEALKPSLGIIWEEVLNRV